MKRLLLALLALALASPAAAAALRTESQAYVLGSDLIVTCDPSTTNVGGACFTVKSGETAVEMTIADDVASPVGGRFEFTTSGGFVVGSGGFCGASGPVTIPTVSPLELWVFVDGTLTGSHCGSGATGTSGTVTAAFS